MIFEPGEGDNNFMNISSPIKPIFTPRSKKEFYQHASNINVEKSAKNITRTNLILIIITIIVLKWDFFGIKYYMPLSISFLIPWIERFLIFYFISNIAFAIFKFFSNSRFRMGGGDKDKDKDGKTIPFAISKAVREIPIARPKRLMIDRSPVKTSPLSESSMKILSSPLGIRSPGTSFTNSSIPGTPIVRTPQSVLSPKSTPDTGSPKVNEELERSMPSWTEKLLTTIRQKQSKSFLSPLSEQYEIKDQIRILKPSLSLSTLNLSENMDSISENVRLWFGRKILIPLQQEIERLSKHFLLAGLERFSPEAPITFALMNSEPSFNIGNVRSTKPSLRPINLSQINPNVSRISFISTFIFILGSKCASQNSS